MTEEIDNLIEAIVQIGNSPKLVKSLEPNIIEPAELKPWMVKRTLTAWILFQEELEKK